MSEIDSTPIHHHPPPWVYLRGRKNYDCPSTFDTVPACIDWLGYRRIPIPFAYETTSSSSLKGIITWMNMLADTAVHHNASQCMPPRRQPRNKDNIAEKKMTRQNNNKCNSTGINFIDSTVYALSVSLRLCSNLGYLRRPLEINNVISPHTLSLRRGGDLKPSIHT